MGWTYCQTDINDNLKDFTSLVKKYVFNNNIDIEYIEKKGKCIWIIINLKNKLEAGLLLVNVSDYEFGYKDISIRETPFYYNCSKKFYNMVAAIYKNDTDEMIKKWLKTYNEIDNEKKEKKNILKNIKPGTTIHFLNTSYAGNDIFTVTDIFKNKVIFNNHLNLKNWKKQKFEIIGG